MIVRELLDRDIRVVALARSFSQKLDLQQTKNRVIRLHSDVSSHECMRKTASKLAENDIHPSILFACAAIGHFDYFDKLAPDDFRQMLLTNVDGVANSIRAFSGSLFKADGKICVLGSIAGYKSFPKGTAYCASKFALVGFCDALRQELQEIGTRIILINPGLINTNFIPNAPHKLLKKGMESSAVGRLIVDLTLHPTVDFSEVKVRASGGQAGDAFTKIISKIE